MHSGSEIKIDSKLRKLKQFVKQYNHKTVDFEREPKIVEAWIKQTSTLQNLLKKQPLPLIIALHHHHILSILVKQAIFLKQILQIMQKQSRNSQNQNLVQMKKLLQILVSCVKTIHLQAFNCLIQYKQIYSQDFKKLFELGIIQTSHENRSQSILQKLLSKLYTIYEVNKYSDFRLRLEINKYILQDLLQQKSQTDLQQIAYNWLKAEAEVFQKERIQQICCRIHFQHNLTGDLGKFAQAANHQFKDYHWPLQNQSIRGHLTHTIVGYLNTIGGIIYVGIKQSKDKMMLIKGIKLSDNQMQQFLVFLQKDILQKVYPKEGKQQEYPIDMKSKKSQHRIHRYIHVDFLNIYEKDTFLDARDSSQKLYVVRIKVQHGNPKQIYHVINSKQVPEVFMRQDKSVKRKTMKQFHDFFYDRIGSHYQIHHLNKNIVQHDNCRFKPNEVNDSLQRI